MKKIMLLTLLLILIVGCSENTGIDKTTIRLKVDKTTIEANGKDAVLFTVVDQDGKDVTSQSTISVNGSPISKHTFTTEKADSYIAIAFYKDVESNAITIKAIKPEEPETPQTAELKLTADKVTILANNKDKVTFTVEDVDGNDITEKAKIKVNNIGLASNTFITSKQGEHKAMAEWDGKKSNEVTIQAMEEADINLYADKIKIYNSGKDEVTFTVKKKGGTDITAECTFKVNDESIEGNKFTSTEAGKYKVQAFWNANKSNNVFIEVVAVALEIKADKESFTADGLDAIAFRLINTEDDNMDLTNQTTFFVDGSEIEGNLFKTEKVGTYSVTAKYLDYEAGPIEVTAVDASEMKITSKVFLEDFTADWCGNCPRVLRVVESAVETGKAVALAVHINDKMEAPDSRKIGNLFGVEGFPTIVIDRDKSTLAHSISLNTILSHVEENPQVGAAMSAQKDGDEIVADITFVAKSKMNLKAVVILGENKIEGKQSNMPELKEHNHVYRATHDGQITGASFEIVPGTPKKKSYSFPIKSKYKTENCFVIVLITDASNDQVINAQWVEVGKKVGY